MTNSQVTARLTELKKTFCKDLYWNHDPSQGNDPESVRSVACTHTHPGSCNTDGSCGCNSFASSIQCHGFAQYMAYRVFGSHPAVNVEGYGDANGQDMGNGWKLYGGAYCRNLTLEPGDIIRDLSHTAIVWKNENGTISVGEVWGTEGCKINWGSFNSSTISSSNQQTILSAALYVVKAPKSIDTITVKFYRNFNADDNTVLEVCEYVPGQSYGTMPTATRSHFRFDGWYPNRDGNNKYEPEDIVKSYSYNLYAHWTYEICVDFNRNYTADDENIFVTKTYYSADDKYGTIDDPSRYSFEFLGWAPNRNDPDGVYDMSTHAVRYDHTLYAQWRWLAPVKFMRNYTSDDETLSAKGFFIPGQSYESGYRAGDNMPADSSMTRSHFRFDGWFSGRTDGTKFTKSSEVPSFEHSLYAHWTWLAPVKFFRNYNDNDDTVLYEIDFEPGKPYGTMPAAPTRAGYIFDGWFADRTGGNPYTKDTTVPSYGHNLYAQWSPVAVVNFNSNFAGGATSSVELAAGKPFGDALTSRTPVREGFTFGGWYTAPTGGTQVDAATIVPEGNTTLYARWQVTITFETYGGELGCEREVLYDAGVPYGYLPESCCRGKSWSFVGWYSDIGGTGDPITVESIVPLQNTTLYAKWNKEA